VLRAGFEPATCRLGVDNGNVAGPQQKRERRGHGVQTGIPASPRGRRGVVSRTRRLSPLPGNRTASARDDLLEGKPARIRTRTCEVGARCAPVTPRACASGWPGSNGPLRSGAPVLFPLSYIRVEHARLESNQRPLPSQSSALSAELRASEGASGRSRTRTSALRRARACR
jgi:hypothetical protein